MPTRAGSTQGLAEIVDKPVTTIAEVADRLGEIYDHARNTTTAGDDDGIACFSGLYRTITRTIDVTPYEDATSSSGWTSSSPAATSTPCARTPAIAPPRQARGSSSSTPAAIPGSNASSSPRRG
jgi:hypothetical protein